MLALSVAATFLWAHWPTFHALERRWAQDPQYSHGYVVPVFALIVLWFRRASFPAAEVGPSWWGLPFLFLGAAARLISAFVYLGWLDALSLLPTLAGIVLLFGGWPALRWSWPGVVLLLFLMPLPFQVDMLLAAPLRRVATLASTYALQTIGLPAISEGNIIIIDDLEVGVVEACSGLGMLMTFFALSTAVAFVIQRPLFDRLVVFASAIPIGVLMNVLRVTVTVFLFRTTDARIAKVVFHDVAGWVMMPLALAVLGLELLFLSRLFVKGEPIGPVRVPLALQGPASPVTFQPMSRPEPSADRSLLETSDVAP
jgi:exosortase